MILRIGSKSIKTTGSAAFAKKLRQAREPSAGISLVFLVFLAFLVYLVCSADYLVRIHFARFSDRITR